MTTPESALIDYFDNDQKFDDIWPLLHDGTNEVESYEILANIHAAAEKVFQDLDNGERELETFAQFVENQIQDFEFHHKEQCFVKKELKKFLRIMKHGWKNLRKKLEKTWERESMKSALMDVLNDPTVPSRTNSVARSIHSVQVAPRYEHRSVSRSRDPRSESVPLRRKGRKRHAKATVVRSRKNPISNLNKVRVKTSSSMDNNNNLTVNQNRINFQKWVNLAEQKSFGKSLIDNWRDQDVLEDLDLSHITEDVLLSQGLAKIQCVVLLKWKQTVLSGRNSSRKKSSPIPRPQSHLYIPSRPNDTGSRNVSHVQETSRNSVKKSRDPLVMLWNNFDHEETGWIKTSQMPDLIFCSLLLFRQQQLNGNPTLELPTREEIKPLVNGIVWEVMKSLDLERPGFLCLNEYKALSTSLLQEWKKVCQRQEPKPVTVEQDAPVPEPVVEAENSNENLESTNESDIYSEDDKKLQDSKFEREIQKDEIESALRQQLLKDPTLGKDLMFRIIRECDNWNKSGGSTSDLLDSIRNHLSLTEKKLNMIEEISI